MPGHQPKKRRIPGMLSSSVSQGRRTSYSSNRPHAAQFDLLLHFSLLGKEQRVRALRPVSGKTFSPEQPNIVVNGIHVGPPLSRAVAVQLPHAFDGLRVIGLQASSHRRVLQRV